MIVARSAVDRRPMPGRVEWAPDGARCEVQLAVGAELVFSGRMIRNVPPCSRQAAVTVPAGWTYDSPSIPWPIIVKYPAHLCAEHAADASPEARAFLEEPA